MSAWPPFDDPLYLLFDWPRRSPSANSAWFSNLMRDQTRIYYALENEFHDLIGRISLREICGCQSARLGIGLGAEYIGKGYGTESLTVFLRYCFIDLGFERIVLDVSAINKRAIRCYERCGFKHSGSHYEFAGTDADIAFLKDERYKDLRRFFRKRDRRNWMLSCDMVLEKKDRLEQQRPSERRRAGSRVTRPFSP